MSRKRSKIVEDKTVPEKTYTCYSRFDEDQPEIVAGGIKTGIALELAAAPTVFNLDDKKRIKHVGAMEFRSASGKKFTLFLAEDKVPVILNEVKHNG